VETLKRRIPLSFTLLHSETRVAAKEHCCIWCNEKIVVGERYLRESSIYDGDFQDQKWHLECHKACLEENKGQTEWELYPGESERPKERLGLCKESILVA